LKGTKLKKGHAEKKKVEFGLQKRISFSTKSADELRHERPARVIQNQAN